MFIALPRDEHENVIEEGWIKQDEMEMWKEMYKFLDELPLEVTHITLHTLPGMQEVNALWRSQAYFKMRGFI